MESTSYDTHTTTQEHEYKLIATKGAAGQSLLIIEKPDGSRAPFRKEDFINRINSINSGIQIKLISDKNQKRLEESVNDFLLEVSPVDIVDIKFDESMETAAVIYKIHDSVR